MALASLAASLPVAATAAAVRFPFRFRIGRAMASAAAGASPARVAVVQMTSVGDVDANYATCSRLTKEAAASGVKFLCFPEVFSFIGSKDGEAMKLAEPLDGPIMQRYCSLAKESSMWLSLGGFQEKGPDDSHQYNTHVLIDDTGKVRSSYRKIHLSLE
ncbi:Nitrilase-like protein 2 [Zea mays]|uniref:Nitrilase-like protein 2 n=1 Tax=Zea mays TaxID=4577 RepID=A0A1D6IV75_MAIZE|nr:Nitrilase-like protein 2 [Zea mays]